MSRPARFAEITERLERGAAGLPIYVHAATCPSFCDYACNGKQSAVLLDIIGILADAGTGALATLTRTKERLVALRYTRGACPFCGQSPHRSDCALIPILDDINAAIRKATGEGDGVRRVPILERGNDD
jgi:hypothetical protein